LLTLVFCFVFLLDSPPLGVLFLFANFFGRINAVFGVTSPSTGDFTTSWYQTVGVGICLVQIGDIVSPHLWKVSFEIINYSKSTLLDIQISAETNSDERSGN
jgi:hypothetical protein